MEFRRLVEEHANQNYSRILFNGFYLNAFQILNERSTNVEMSFRVLDPGEDPIGTADAKSLTPRTK